MTLLLTCWTSIIRKNPEDSRNTSNCSDVPVLLCSCDESCTCIFTGDDTGKAIFVSFSCKADTKSSVELKSVIWIALRGNPQPWIKHLRVIREKKSPNMPMSSPELDNMVYGGTRRTDTLSPFWGQKWGRGGCCMKTELQSKVAMTIVTIEFIRSNAISNTTVLLWWPTKKERWALFTAFVIHNRPCDERYFANQQ